MRQIRFAAQAIARLLFNKESISYEISDPQQPTAADMLHNELNLLINNRKINEAENLLFDKLEESNPAYLELALDFYQRVSELDDDILKACDYSRNEILQGIEQLMQIYDISL